MDLGADVDNYTVSQQVRVFYDRDDPSRLTINDEDNQSGGSVYLTIAVLVGGVFALGASIWQGGRWLAHRRRVGFRSRKLS